MTIIQFNYKNYSKLKIVIQKSQSLGGLINNLFAMLPTNDTKFEVVMLFLSFSM